MGTVHAQLQFPCPKITTQTARRRAYVLQAAQEKHFHTRGGGGGSATSHWQGQMWR